MKSYDDENKEVFKSFLERKFFSNFRRVDKDGNVTRTYYNQIELFITSDCNLSCSYCYLYKNGNKLYPKESRNMEQILKNIGILLDWCIEEGFVSHFALFSGEFLSLGEYTFKILDLLYEKAVYSKDKGYCVIHGMNIPSNMTFILDYERTARIEEYLAKFLKIGIFIGISASIDGKYLESQTRPKKCGEEDRDDAYYEKVFKFIVKNRGGFHPMVASHGIEHWKENHRWFVENLAKYGEKRPPMMLEVRNDDWTEESIQEYLKFLDSVIDYEFNERDRGNVRIYTKRIFLHKLIAYDNVSLQYKGQADEGIGCAIQKTFYVRCGDLAIVPCHRLSYEHFLYGKFVVENDKIVDIEPINVPMALTVYSMVAGYQPKCMDCEAKDWCHKGCLGSQYEASGEPFLPIDSVCNMYKARFRHLFKRYYEMGVLHEAMNLNMNGKIKDAINKSLRGYGLDEIISKKLL